MDARIGTLQTAEGIVYYAFANGYDKPEVRSKNLDDVERALGLKPVIQKVKTPRPIRTFIVSITPKYKTYAGSWQSGPYEVEVFAKDRNEAIKRAREDYNSENSGNPATYRAKLKQG